MPVDTTGDGRANAVAVDTTGDGTHDKVLPIAQPMGPDPSQMSVNVVVTPTPGMPMQPHQPGMPTPVAVPIYPSGSAAPPMVYPTALPTQAMPPPAYGTAYPSATVPVAVPIAQGAAYPNMSGGMGGADPSQPSRI